MTAVWDEVVEYEVVKEFKLGIQCNAMFYSLCNLLIPLTGAKRWC